MKRRSMAMTAGAGVAPAASPFTAALPARIPAHRLTAKDVAWAIEVAASCVEGRAVERVVRAATPADAMKAAREMLRYWGSHGFGGEVSALSLGNSPAAHHNAGLHIRVASRRGFLPWRIVAQLLRKEVAPSDVVRATGRAMQTKTTRNLGARERRGDTAMAKKWDEAKMKAKVEKLRAEGKAFSEIQREFGGKQGDGSYKIVQRIAKAWDAAHPAQAAKLHVGRTLAAVAGPKKATAPKPNGSGPSKQRKLTAKERLRQQRQDTAKALNIKLGKGDQKPVARPAEPTAAPTARKRKAA